MRKNNKNRREHKKKPQKKRKEKFKFTENLLVDHPNPVPPKYSKCLTPLTEAKMSNNIESQEEKKSNIFLFSLTNILHSFLSKPPKPSNNILVSNI